MDYTILEDALNEIVRRHSALRAGFVQADVLNPEGRAAELESFASTGVFRPGLYRQIVSDRARIQLRIVDLPACPLSERPAAIQHEIQQQSARDFNPEHPPLIRAILLRVDPREHFLVFVIDHLIGDAWSMRIIRREFAEIYAAFRGGRRSSLEDSRLSYPDYAVRQDQMIRNGDFARALDYWRAQWSAYAPHRVGFGDLPFSLSPPASPTYAFGSESSSFDLPASRELRVFARKTRITPYVLFLGAFGRLLRRYTNGDRLAIWGHFANRMAPGVHGSVGWFSTTHLIGMDVTAGTSSRELLLSVRRSILDATEHQEMPVALLWRVMGAYPRDPDAKVLLDVSVADDPSAHPEDNGELQATHAVDLTPSFGRFSSLGLYIRDDRERFHLAVQYSLDRFPQAAIQTLLNDFRGEVIGMLSA